MNGNPKNQHPFLSLTFIILLVSLLLGVLLTPPVVSADLPPRPTPVPTKTPTPAPSTSDSLSQSERSEKPIGAYIELSRPANGNGLWTVVQWQRSDGRWHDVEGWRGTFEEGKKVWWVASSDFGKGPFRWAVYQGQGGVLLGISPSFNLPTSGYQSAQIGVMLAP